MSSYKRRTYQLTLSTTDTPTGVPAVKRLALVLKQLSRRWGFKCDAVVEIDKEADVRPESATS